MAKRTQYILTALIFLALTAGAGALVKMEPGRSVSLHQSMSLAQAGLETGAAGAGPADTSEVEVPEGWTLTPGGILVSPPVTPSLSQPLSEIPPAQHKERKKVNNEHEASGDGSFPNNPDPVVQTHNPQAMPTPLRVF
ncbi:MAG TPA: hypothetical protein VEX13_18565, partial [Chloroflexia bacterium]|nr:hypothetical protein [Chloroflexia bacterium]